jgi:peroxiredoxin
VAIGCYRKQKDTVTEIKAVPVVNEIPSLPVSLLNGKTIDLKNHQGQIILVLFQPDCDHCQREAKQIEEHLKSFKNYTMYFVSSAPVEGILKFSKDYHLDEKPNVLFGATSTTQIINNFGPIQAPSIYIYSQQGKLVHHFNGEVDIQVLLNYL